MLTGREPYDARTSPRAYAACAPPRTPEGVAAIDGAMGNDVPDNARMVRNLVLGANFIHSHILHFYHLAVLDYIEPPAMAPWTRGTGDTRIDPATARRSSDTTSPPWPCAARPTRWARCSAAGCHTRRRSWGAGPRRSRPPASEFRATPTRAWDSSGTCMVRTPTHLRDPGDYLKIGRSTEPPRIRVLRRRRDGGGQVAAGAAGAAGYTNVGSVDGRKSQRGRQFLVHSPDGAPPGPRRHRRLPEDGRVLVAQVAALRDQAVRGRSAGPNEGQRRLRRRRVRDGPPAGARARGHEDRPGNGAAGSTSSCRRPRSRHAVLPDSAPASA